MTDLYPFLVAGLVSGSVYGLTATGLVLTYRTSGLFNFGHGALAAAGAYAFYQLRDQWGWPWPVALVVVLGVFGPVVGLLLERLARRLAAVGTAAKVVATVGLLIAVQGLLSAVYGPAARSMRTFLPTTVYSVGSVNVGLDQLLVFAVAAGAVGVLTACLRATRLGTAMRGVVDDPDLLDLAGTDPVRVRRVTWVIGASFASLSGVLLAPTIGLDALLLTLLVVQAFGAAAVGRFSSLPLTFAGGLLVGVLASLSTKYLDMRSLQGLPASLPFIVLFTVLLLTRRGRLVELGAARPARAGGTAEAGARTLPPFAIPAVLAVVLAVLPFVAGSRLPVLTTALAYVLVFSSLRLLVGTSGQVSLCHVTFAAVGATSMAHLTTGLGLPWAPALLGAGLVAVPVGAVVAVPAIRLSGLYLALATLGFGILVDRLVYPMAVMFGADGLAVVRRPALAGLDLASSRGYYYVCLLVVAVGLAVVHVVNRSRLGRLLRGLADSPLALATLGLGVDVTRVIVFCISAFLAGVAGALLASLAGTTAGSSFASFSSLTLVVVLAVAGRGELTAPVVASAALFVVPSYVRNEMVNEALPVVFGVAAMAAAASAGGGEGGALRLPAVVARWARRAPTSRVRVRMEPVP